MASQGHDELQNLETVSTHLQVERKTGQIQTNTRMRV